MEEEWRSGGEEVVEGWCRSGGVVEKSRSSHVK